MLQNETIDRIKERYVRRYTVTLALTDENVREALRVAYTGITEKLGIYQALIKVYGYRYRRMENFIRELGLWTKEGWVTWDVEVKIYSWWYTETEKGPEEITSETSYTIPTPPSIVYFTEKENETFLISLHEALLASIGFFIPSARYSIGIELLEMERVWDWEDYTILDVYLTIYISSRRTSKAFAGKGKIGITNFAPFATLVPPNFDIIEAPSVVRIA